MSAQTTCKVTRGFAIKRINAICNHIREHDYLSIEAMSFETDYDIAAFVMNGVPNAVEHIEKWTNGMLAQVLDLPFFRTSCYENYLVSDQHEE